jgi:multicomponent K+:H+ antiporter subunit E
MNTWLRRGLPSPVLSLVLLIMWLLLNPAWSLGQLLLGAVLAVVIPWFTHPLHSDHPRMRRPILVLRLFFIVLKDIVTSNIDVAKLILGRESHMQPGFVWVPLTLTDAHGIVALAGIITMTPGTLSADLSNDRKHLLVHALNVTDEAALIESIKSRYEKPLLEIFQ